MNLRPKTKRRLLALTAGGVVFTAAASVLIYVQLNREESRQRELRANGLGAYQRGAFAEAIADFKQYLGNDRLDGEAVYAYAVSRSRVPLPDLGHLREAKSLFTRYLELKPGDPGAQHQLLDIYRRLNYTAEADVLADTLLSHVPDDVPALNVKLAVLADKAKYADALKISQKLNTLTPLDLRTQEITYDLMLRCKRPAAELNARADGMLAEHPADPRFELLRADAAALTGDLDTARRWLRTAATRPQPDSQSVQMLAGAMDRVSMWNDAGDLIAKSAAAPSAAASITAAWVQRMYEAGQVDQALANLKNVSLDTTSDARLLGLKGLILFTRSVSDPDAAVALKALDDRLDDPIAASWSALLHADFVEGLDDPKRAAVLCASASRQDPDNPIARFDQARAFLRLGESELALKCLRQTTDLSPGWSTPYVIMARTLLERNQVLDASDPAHAAFERNTTSAPARTTLVVTADLQPRSTDLPAQLDFAKTVHQELPDDYQVLAAYADLLARTDHKQEASDLILATIASPSINAGTLCDLLKVSDANHLDLTDAIADRATRHAPGSPEGLVDQVRLFTAAGRAVETHRTIRNAIGHDRPEWLLAILRCREMAGDPGLTPEWAKLADGSPTDLTIQHATLASTAAWADRNLIDRVISRCRDLTGTDAVQWRMARARWQLESPQDTKANATAVATEMADVAGDVPRMVEAHLIWAEALQRLGDQTGAIKQMRDAQAIAQTPAVTVELARLLAAQGQYHEAVTLTESVAGSPALSAGSRVSAVRVYCQAGEPKKAIDLLENMPGDHTVEQDLLLARIYTDQGDDVSASHLYGRLLQVSNPTPAVLRAYAWFQASRGNVTDGRDTIKRMDLNHGTPGEAALAIADFEAAFGTAESATTAYQAAARQAPNDPKPWVASAGFKLRSRDYPAAAVSVDQGLKQCPGDPTLNSLSVQIKFLASLSAGVEIQPLVDAIAGDPTNPSAVGLLNDLVASRSAGESADKLQVRLADAVRRDPRFLPAQLMLASSYAATGLTDDAVRVARQMTESFPTSVEPARMLTRIEGDRGDWQAGLNAAANWRNRSLAHPQPADNAIAMAQQRLNHPEVSVAVLSPYLPRCTPVVQTAPDVASDDSTTVAVYARALAVEQRYAEMQSLAAPLCKQSAGWRHQVLRMVAETAPDAATAAAQMAPIEAMVPAGSVDDRIAMADARYTAGVRLNDTELLQRSLDVLDPLTDAGAVPVDAWLLLGAIHQHMNQPTEAEAAYRKAIALSSTLPKAKNNLAVLILQRNGDLKEARTLSEQAVSIDPNDGAIHLTLGEIASQQGDLDVARAHFETATRLDPQNATALVALAETQCKAAQLDKAIETVRRIDNVMQVIRKPLDPAVRQQLDRVREACKRASAVG